MSPLSPAVRCGGIAFAAAVLLAVIDPRLATVPLTLFVALCAVAPFLPRAGFFFPVVYRGNTGRPMVALTFDDGPDPATTPRLLDLLDRHGVQATFFVTGRRAARHPHLVREIVRRGHTLGNHTYHHGRLAMYWRPALLRREIADTQAVLKQADVVPLAFRPPVGITTPPMAGVLAAGGLFTVNFSCRAADWGNRRIRRLSAAILKRVKPDDIILLHDTDAGSVNRNDRWLHEIERILKGLPARGLSVAPLERLIGRPVSINLSATP